MEAKIAKMTVNIRYRQECMEEFPRNLRVKVHLKELIDKRKKYLKYLRRWDYKRFEWLLEKLDLVYKPPPP
jgi:small subunit ribosomal protein S15